MTINRLPLVTHNLSSPFGGSLVQAAVPLQELGWRGGEAREGEITINECFIKAKNLHSMILLGGLALEHKKKNLEFLY